MSKDLKATGLLSMAIMGSRVLGLAREVVFAALFGARGIADAYQVAFRIPNLLRDLLSEGALSSAFVPTFRAELEHADREAAFRLANLVLGALSVVTGLLTVLAIVFADEIVWVMSQGFAGDDAKVELCARLTRLMMPILMLVSLGAVWMGMLNAQRRFLAPALAPILFNGVSIATAIVVAGIGASLEDGIAIWAIGTLVAGAVQSGVQLMPLWRTGYRPRFRFAQAWSHPGVRRIAALMGPALIGVAAVQINVIVNTGFAGRLGDGAVAQLSYAFRLFFLPLGVFGVALGTVATTSVSEAAAKRDHAGLVQRWSDAQEAGWMLTSASALGLFLLADPIVTLVYRYGATTAADAESIARCLQAYVLGLVPYSLIKITAPCYYSVDAPRIPLFASLAGVATNIVFNAVMFQTLGAPGIALGTAVGAATNYAVLRGFMGSKVAPVSSAGRFGRWGALLAGNLVLAAVVLVGQRGMAALDPAVGDLGPWLWRLTLLGELTIVIGVAAVAYFVVLRGVGYPGAAQLASIPRRVLGKLRRR